LTYLLIIFIIALALAPLSHFVPSKRQRRIARMREYAAVHGMFVEFRNLPGADRQHGQRAQATQVIYYGKRLPPRRGAALPGASFVADDQGWRKLGRRGEVPLQLHDLPQEIRAASVDEGSCGIYWQEAGDEQQVEQIRQVLESWSEDLSA
jgi:hypothetical protein